MYNTIDKEVDDMSTTIDTIRNTIRNIVEKRGYVLEERKSGSTDSWYFKIRSGENSLLFRISDHKTKTNVITLRVDHKTSFKNIVSFINNRCDDLALE